MDASVKVVACPTCRGDTKFSAANPYRPFCSARCRGVDLGAWANESYRVLGGPSDEADSPTRPEPDLH